MTGQMTAAQRIVASGGNEWYTPAQYIEAARATFGGVIDLDPASCPKANETVRARKIYTAEDDGLKHDWHGTVWLNPPYGNLAGKFVQHFVDQIRKGNILAGIVLVNSHTTDTKWFQPLWDMLLCFTDHRIDFQAGDHSQRTGSTHGSVFAYYGFNDLAFQAEFDPFGRIVKGRGLRWHHTAPAPLPPPRFYNFVTYGGADALAGSRGRDDLAA